MDNHLLSPLQDRERIVLLDTVRGLALLGVMLGNGMEQLHANSLEAVSAGVAAGVDGFFNEVYLWFVRGKARTLFMLLFGIGFALQLERIARHGADPAQLFRRRMLVLLGIGLLHQFLFSMVDIIHFYAIAGLALLLFRDWPAARLYNVGLVFAVTGFALGGVAAMLVMSPEEWRLAQGVLDTEAARRAALLPEATYWQFLQMNASHYFSFVISPWAPGFLVQMFGVFLLGLWIARRDFLGEIDRLKPLFRRWWWRLLLFGLLYYVAAMLFREHLADMARFGRLAWSVLAILVWVMMTAAYAMVVSLLLDRASLQRLWRGLASVGRMALTNYVMQSLLFLFVLYGPGFGLLPHFGPTWMFAFVAVAFVFQVGFSHWWLERHRFGPLEWLWRSLTYRRWQALRRETAGSLPTAA